MTCITGFTIPRKSAFAEDNDSVSSAAEVEPPPLLDSAPARPETEPFTEAFARQFAERFKRENPPVIPTPRKLTKLELLESVLPEVIQYLQAGYSYEAIAVHFTGLGVPIRTRTLKSYVRRLRASSGPAPHRHRVPRAPAR